MLGQAEKEDLPLVMPIINKKENIEILGFLRALAALSVCLYHYTGAVLPKLRIESVREVFQDGWLGVDVFFVISGFIIPYSLMRKNYEVSGFFSYMKRRIIRINPPAYLAMALVLMQGYVIDHFISHRSVYTAGISWGQIANNLAFTIPFSKYKWVVGIFWTLAIEFQFYIFVGVLFKYLFERLNIYIFSIIFLFMGPIQYLPFHSNESFFRFSTLFALGGIALLYHTKRIGLKQYVLLIFIFFAAAYIELGAYISITGIITVFCINFVKFKSKIFDFLGNISYSFYLLHALIGTTCEYFLIKIINPEILVNKIIMLMICISFAIIGSYVYYVLVEKKFITIANQKIKQNKR